MEAKGDLTKASLPCAVVCGCRHAPSPYLHYIENSPQRLGYTSHVGERLSKSSAATCVNACAQFGPRREKEFALVILVLASMGHTYLLPLNSYTKQLGYYFFLHSTFCYATL